MIPRNPNEKFDHAYGLAQKISFLIVETADLRVKVLCPSSMRTYPACTKNLTDGSGELSGKPKGRVSFQGSFEENLSL